MRLVVRSGDEALQPGAVRSPRQVPVAELVSVPGPWIDGAVTETIGGGHLDGHDGGRPGYSPLAW